MRISKELAYKNMVKIETNGQLLSNLKFAAIL